MCLEAFETRGARTKVNPFQCSHDVCGSCHTRLLGESDHRCPVCRAPRVGLTAGEAEPDPARNHQPPTLADALAELGVEAFHGELARRGPGLATGAAGGYGGLAALAARGPATTMFFPVEPPTSLVQGPRSSNPENWEPLEQMVQSMMAAVAQARGQGAAPASAPRVPTDLLGSVMHPDDVRTLLDLAAPIAFADPPMSNQGAAVRALLDLPNVSLAQWNERHRSAAAPARRAAAAPRTGRRTTTPLGSRRRSS